MPLPIQQLITQTFVKASQNQLINLDRSLNDRHFRQPFLQAHPWTESTYKDEEGAHYARNVCWGVRAALVPIPKEYSEALLSLCEEGIAVETV
jgi:hypothetical protein